MNKEKIHDVEINISEGDSKPIPMKKVLKILSGFQEMVYSVAEMKARISTSKTGRKTSAMRAACELLITKVKSGSVGFCVRTRKPEITLFGEDMFGMETLATSEMILEYIAEKDINSIVKTVPDVIYRDKIIGKAQAFLPSGKSDTKVSIKNGQKQAVQVSKFDAKELINIMLPKKEESPIDHGYSKPADVKGIAHFDSNGKFDRFVDILEVTDLPVLKISYVVGKEYKYNFKQPIFFDIQEEGEHLQIIKQKDLDIVTTADSGKEILSALGEEFDLIWHEFAEADDSTLHESGLLLKEKLIGLVDNREIIS